MKNTLGTLCALMAFVFWANVSGAMGPIPTQEADPLAGKIAYDVTLPTAQGAQQSLSAAQQGQKAILVFWATWCPHCHDELLRINQKLQDITAAGIKVILIDIGESREEVARYLHKNNIALDSFVDEDVIVQEPFGIVGVPTLVFLDPKRVIRHVRYDFPDDYASLF